MARYRRSWPSPLVKIAMTCWAFRRIWSSLAMEILTASTWVADSMALRHSDRSIHTILYESVTWTSSCFLWPSLNAQATSASMKRSFKRGILSRSVICTTQARLDQCISFRGTTTVRFRSNVAAHQSSKWTTQSSRWHASSNPSSRRLDLVHTNPCSW